jgi:Ca-activated chloride channel family protein
LMGYEDRAIPDAQFRNDVVDAGEIGAGHRVTALYQVVLTGAGIPQVTGAAPVADGAPYAGTHEVNPGDAVLVKVRYKDVGASATDPAHEVAKPLSTSAIHGDIAGTDVDMRWAVSVAAFSEVLRGSPYAKKSSLDGISGLLQGAAGTNKDRVAFLDLFGKARTLMGP